MAFWDEYRTNAALSLSVIVNIFEGLDIGSAFETPSDDRLSSLNLRTCEIQLRVQLGIAGN